MYSVPERIEDGCDFLINSWIMSPDVGHGQRDQFCKSSGTVDTNASRVRTEMASTSEAVATTAARDVTFSAHDVAGIKVVDIGPDLYNLAHKLVANRHGNSYGLLRPLVPQVDMHVSAADARLVNANQYIIDADSRFRDLLQPESPLRFALDQRLHKYPQVI